MSRMTTVGGGGGVGCSRGWLGGRLVTEKTHVDDLEYEYWYGGLFGEVRGRKWRAGGLYGVLINELVAVRVDES